MLLGLLVPADIRCIHRPPVPAPFPPCCWLCSGHILGTYSPGSGLGTCGQPEAVLNEQCLFLSNFQALFPSFL